MLDTYLDESSGQVWWGVVNYFSDKYIASDQNDGEARQLQQSPVSPQALTLVIFWFIPCLISELPAIKTWENLTVSIATSLTTSSTSIHPSLNLKKYPQPSRLHEAIFCKMQTMG